MWLILDLIWFKLWEKGKTSKNNINYIIQYWNFTDFLSCKGSIFFEVVWARNFEGNVWLQTTGSKEWLEIHNRKLIYRRTPESAVYRGPKKKLENWRSKRFVSFKTRAKRERAVTAAQTRPLLDSSSFVPVPTFPRKLANILLLAFSLFELVAALSQCLCSVSNKKNGEVGEYPR